jgi:hypothetical protein
MGSQAWALNGEAPTAFAPLETPLRAAEYADVARYRPCPGVGSRLIGTRPYNGSCGPGRPGVYATATPKSSSGVGSALEPEEPSLGGRTGARITDGFGGFARRANSLSHRFAVLGFHKPKQPETIPNEEVGTTCEPRPPGRASRGARRAASPRARR